MTSKEGTSRGDSGHDREQVKVGVLKVSCLILPVELFNKGVL